MILMIAILHRTRIIVTDKVDAEDEVDDDNDDICADEAGGYSLGVELS
jgi:hypothetical protein